MDNFNEESQLAIYLDEFSQYIGAKIVVDFIIVAEAVNSLIIIALFYLLQNKMFYWLDHMHFDNESRCFYKLNLNISDSKRFTKQFAMLIIIMKRLIYVLDSIAFMILSGSFIIFTNQDYLYYFISITIYSISMSYMSNHWFS